MYSKNSLGVYFLHHCNLKQDSTLYTDGSASKVKCRFIPRLKMGKVGEWQASKQIERSALYCFEDNSVNLV